MDRWKDQQDDAVQGEEHHVYITQSVEDQRPQIMRGVSQSVTTPLPSIPELLTDYEFERVLDHKTYEDGSPVWNCQYRTDDDIIVSVGQTSGELALNKPHQYNPPYQLRPDQYAVHITIHLPNETDENQLTTAADGEQSAPVNTVENMFTELHRIVLDYVADDTDQNTLRGYE